MGKHKKRKKKRHFLRAFFLSILFVIVVAAIVWIVVPEVLYVMQSKLDISKVESSTQALIATTESSNPVTQESSTVPQHIEIAFPAILADGKLEVESVFQFSGINPDAGLQEASDVAAVIIKNTSGTYLKTATIRAVFNDEKEQQFVVYDLPAGKTAMAFSADNQKMLESDICVDIDAEADFEDVGSVEGVRVSVEGMTVTLENISGGDLLGIAVYCRDVLGDNYFGGVAHKYTIEKIAAGESVTITASDCIMGVTDVVRIVVSK